MKIFWILFFTFTILVRQNWKGQLSGRSGKDHADAASIVLLYDYRADSEQRIFLRDETYSSGWQLTCRYLVSPEFKTYFQTTITLDREGHMAVPDLKFGGSLGGLRIEGKKSNPSILLGLYLKMKTNHKTAYDILKQ